MSLHQFITTHRTDLIARTRAKVAGRSEAPLTGNALESGVPVFLEQLIEALRLAAPSAASLDAIAKSATFHGGTLVSLGLSVGQVVHGYGDVCQAVTELADELNADLTIDEFHTLNRCLDDAIAEAVSEFTRLKDAFRTDEQTQKDGVLGHEIRNRLAAATLAFGLITRGTAAANGSVANVVSRNLKAIGALLDRSLLEVRIESGNIHRTQISVRELIEEAENDAAEEFKSRGVTLVVEPVAHELVVEADRHVLSGALANLLRNAVKFTKPGGCVKVSALGDGPRVSLNVADECGGLPAGKTQELFDAFEQRGTDRSGLGLGLFISRRAVEASRGVIHVHDVPGQGCVFTIDLPLISAA